MRLMNENFQLPKGRGALSNPANRFDSLRLEPDTESAAPEFPDSVRTQFYRDHSRKILAKNTSPDIPFTYSLNPYRGCEHGCVYCYARPTHEFLGFSAGLDFETRIIVKADAPVLLEATFRTAGWKPQIIALSGNTDCYQLIERKLRLTRRCLQVFLRFRNPVSMITKNALIVRDLDILTELAHRDLVAVSLSVTSLSNRLCRVMEPRTSAPHKRLRAITRLAQNGISVGVNLAPIIPGLNDKEIPAILKAAADAGATRANYILLRLPHGVKQLFDTWLQQHFPDRAKKVLHAIEQTYGGALYDPAFFHRMQGSGVRAEMIRTLFHTTCRRLGLQTKFPSLRTDLFVSNPDQLQLF